jgi:hypothetical protein
MEERKIITNIYNLKENRRTILTTEEKNKLTNQIINNKNKILK